MKRYLAILALLLLIGTVSAAPNLFTYSEQVNNSAWSKHYLYKYYNDTVLAPNGTWTGDTYNTSGGDSIHGVHQAITVTAGLPYTISAYFKKNGVNDLVQLVYASTQFGTAQYTTANISSCEVIVTGGNTSNTYSSENASWCRVSHTSTAVVSGSANAYFLFVSQNNYDAGRAPSYEGTGNTTESIAIWGMQAEQASGPSDYYGTGEGDTSGGWASFTPTESVNRTVFGTANIAFTNTNTAISPTAYEWTYRNITGDNVLRTFSTSASPTFTFQAPPTANTFWNYSIQLTVTNATGTNSTITNSHFVNVSRWNQTGTDLLPLLPANHIARYNIASLPVHASSTGWINAITTRASGGNVFKVYMGTTGSNIGKKIMYVGTGVPMTTPVFDRVQSQSDLGGSFAWPENIWYDEASGDGNMYVYNRDTHLGYEFSYVDDTDHPDGTYPNGTHVAGTGNIYDYTNLSVHRPLGTSAGSVSGMQRIPLLLTYADMNSGSAITHGFEASWYTTPSISSSDYLWPASATTTYANNASFPSMGARFRLKASTDLSHLQSSHPQAYKVAVALRDYGGFLNIRSGTDGLRINGEADVLTSTDNSALQTACPVTAFEFVDESALMVSADSYAYAGYVPGAAPTANFTADSTSIVVGDTVHFTDHSTGGPISWSYAISPAGHWGYYATPNASITFTSAGVYNVNLTVSNDNGTSSMNRTNYITVTSGVSPPVAGDSCSPLIGYSPLSVTCHDLSVPAATSWYWEWGDGNTSTGSATPTHTYASPGSYTVRLNASNAGGYSWINRTGYVAVNAPPVPAADFYADNVNVTVGGTVHFSDYSTNSPTSWLWHIYDSDGGVTVTTQNPSHVYNTLGNYTVSLTAANGYGPDTETKTDYIHVIAGAPPAPTPTPTGTPTPTPTLTSAPPHDAGYSSHMRPMAVDTIATIPTERYNAIMNALAFTGNMTTETPNFTALPPEIIGTYTDYMGPIALLIIFLIPFGMIWMSHGNMKLLSILGFITCLFVFWYLPANYAYAAWICMGISCVGFMWGLWKQ